MDRVIKDGDSYIIEIVFDPEEDNLTEEEMDFIEKNFYRIIREIKEEIRGKQ